MKDLATALAGPLRAMAAVDQFILWKIVVREGLPCKVPFNASGNACDPHDPKMWMSASEAMAVAPSLGMNVGFTFTASDPFFFLDIDHAKTEAGWSEQAINACAMFPSAAVEVSWSGEGLHVFGSGECPPHSCKNVELGFELYTQSRFVALTGSGARGDSAADCTPALIQAVSKWFVPRESRDGVEWSDTAVEAWSGPDVDADLIKRMISSRSAGSVFGGTVSFEDLWTANEEALGRKFPDDHGARPYDASRVDAALAQHLAFWTGKNCERMERLMRMSELMRDKWEDREDYLVRTITLAVAQQRDVFCASGKPPAPAPDSVDSNGTACVATAVARNGFQYMAPTQQIDHFAGCVYVSDQHRIFLPCGSLVKPESFKALYGGYVFALDSENEKTTKNAFEVFTESQAVRFPKARGVIFKPDEPTGAIIDDGESPKVNTYVAPFIRTVRGDAGPFHKHLSKIAPNEYDRGVLLAYMAAMVQYPGVKFQWAPLIQGCEGNGKTFLTRCVAYAVGRRYVHFPKADDLDNKFNSWLMGKILIGVEDIFVPESRNSILETLKPMITAGDGIEIQMKGVDQKTVDICCNFMLNSNHKDAIRKTATDRRFAIFYTPQQVAGDLEKWGMQGDYFPTLYRWAYSDGYAVVADYLKSYNIPDELNPATSCHRAPITSSTEEAISMSLGGVEQEILEAVSENRVGFAGGWVSSMALDRLLDDLHATRRIPPRKRRPMMQQLGYDFHPALTDGRLNSKSSVDGGKPRLFIANGHLAINLTTGADVQKAYEQAQIDGASAGAGEASRVFSENR